MLERYDYCYNSLALPKLGYMCKQNIEEKPEYTFLSKANLWPQWRFYFIVDCICAKEQYLIIKIQFLLFKNSTVSVLSVIDRGKKNHRTIPVAFLQGTLKEETAIRL